MAVPLNRAQPLTNPMKKLLPFLLLLSLSGYCPHGFAQTLPLGTVRESAWPIYLGNPGTQKVTLSAADTLKTIIATAKSDKLARLIALQPIVTRIGLDVFVRFPVSTPDMDKAYVELKVGDYYVQAWRLSVTKNTVSSPASTTLISYVYGGNGGGSGASTPGGGSGTSSFLGLTDVPSYLSQTTINGKLTQAQADSRYRLLSVPLDYNNLINRPTGTGSGVTSYTALTDRPTIPVVPGVVSAFSNDAGYQNQTATDSRYRRLSIGLDYNTDITANKPVIPVVPTTLSSFTNDSNYQTASQVASAAKAYSTLTGTPVIPSVPTVLSAFTNDAGYQNQTTTDARYRRLSVGLDYNTDITTGKPLIPTVPTLVSAFTNDAGYQTAGQVASAAKAYSTLTGTPVIPVVPTLVSAFTNDATYQTGSQLSTAIGNATNPLSTSIATNTASIATNTANITTNTGNITTLQNAGYQTASQVAISPKSYSTLTGTPTIPTIPTVVSAFTNDAAYRTTNQVAAQIRDTLTVNSVTFSGDFVKSGSTISLANSFTGTVDNTLNGSSTNAVSNSAVSAGLALKPNISHTHLSTDIQNFTTSVLGSLTALSGYGNGTQLSVVGGSLVWATGGVQLSQLSTPVLTVGTVTASTIPLTWAAVTNATNYTLSQAIDPQFSNGLFDVYSGSALTYTPTSLASGTTYYYRLTASGTGYANSNYGFATATTSGAAQPTLTAPTVTVGSATTATLTASWGAVTNATSYSVDYSTSNTFSSGVVSQTTTALTVTPTGLTSATTYYFRVAAVATGYTTSAYGTANGTTTAPAGTTALTAPTLTLSGVGSSSAIATWTASTNATGYSLDRATNSGFSAGLTTVYTGTALTFSNTGLSSSTQYYYRVKATGTGSYTDSPYSTAQTITTSASSGTALVAQAIVLNGATTTSIATSMSLNPNASGYEFQYSTSATFASNVTTIQSGTATYAIQTGLTPNTAYYFRGKSLGTGSYTDGPYSPIVTLTTSNTVAGTYAVSRTIKVNLSHSSNTTTVATWNTIAPALASIVSGYVSPTFVDATGAATTASFSLVAGGGISGANINVYSGTANVPNAIWPAQVMQRAWKFGNSTTFRISGLDPAKYYQVYSLTAQPSSGTQVNTFMTANGIAGGVKYPPGNIGVTGDEVTSGALFTVNNVVATGGQIDLVYTRTLSSFAIEMQGFILVETNIPK